MSTGFMDTSRNFEETLVRPSTIFVNSLKGSADGFSAQSGGLLRYHSAPSSTFSALLEPDFYSTNEATEIAQLLGHNELNDFTSFSPGKFALKPHHNQQCSIQEGQPRHVYSCQNDVLLRQCVPAGTAVFEDHIGQGPLSAILEHTGEETCLPHPCQGEPIATTSSEATSDSDNQYKSDLIRHSSLPTDFLSRLAMIDMSEKPMGSQLGSNMQSSSQQATSHIQSTSPVIPDNTGGKIYMISSRMSPRGVLVRKCLTDEGMPGKQEEYSALHSELNQQCALLRQSSSPAGLLSQLSLDELASPTDKMVTPLTQGLVLHESDATLIDFGMQKIAALGQRKRGREVDAGLLKSSPEDDEMINQIATSPRNHDLGGAANGDFGDSVLCKSRAKRGCATHPRSIAERVRRTKISERIKKLQDLVPNLDKQAHTADMLDEVVEYVKLLQRQVEELSKQSYECDGTCQKK